MAERFVVMETGIHHHNISAGKRHKKPVLICGEWGLTGHWLDHFLHRSTAAGVSHVLVLRILLL